MAPIRVEVDEGVRILQKGTGGNEDLILIHSDQLRPLIKALAAAQLRLIGRAIAKDLSVGHGAQGEPATGYAAPLETPAGNSGGVR